MRVLSTAEEARALEVHRQAILINAHNDLSFDVVEKHSRGERGVLDRDHAPLMLAGGLTVSVEAVGSDSRMARTFPLQGLAYVHTHLYPLKRTLHTLDAFHRELIDEGSTKALLAMRIADIERAKAEGKIAFVLALEGGAPLEDDLSILRTLYRFGVRSISLTWHGRNLLADGNAEPSGSGLSALGIDVVKEMTRLGILVDVSHLSEAGFWDIARIVSGPFIASHSNARVISGGARNLSDEQIRAVAAHGGVIGVNAVAWIVSPIERPTIDDLLDHIDHIVKLVGVDHVGLGLDILEPGYWPSEKYSAVWGEYKSIQYPDGIDSITKLPNITRGLVARGYRDEEIRKILGENFLRVFAAVLM